MKKNIFVLFIGMLSFWEEGAKKVFAQQDAQYSQYMFNQLALNPAYAGSREMLASTLLYRNQWTGIKGSPTTGTFSIQSPMRNKKMGVGAEMISDKIGPKNVSSLLGSYSYRIPFMKGKLSFGLRAGLYNYVIDWTQIDYKDKNDSYNTSNKTSRITASAAFGLYYYTHTFYWGMCFDHLNKGNITNPTFDTTSKQAPHFFMPIGKAFVAGTTVIHPTLVLKSAYHSPTTIDLSLHVQLKEKVWIGVSLRSGYGTVLFTQLQANKNLKIGYAYDIGKNKIGIIGKSSHEIMIGYDINIHGTKILMPRFL